MVGPESCCNPSLGSLAGPFGLAPLVGKSVALVDDARVPDSSDGKIITGHLLTISGNDKVSVNRKHKEEVGSVKLGVRFVVSSNELPQLPDPGRALPNRWSVLQFPRSFLGKEDTTLERRLLAELPGIFLWAVEGWRRLQEPRPVRRFTRPAASEAAHELLGELSSSALVFITDRCEVGESYRARVTDMFTAWCDWCEETGRRPGTREDFARQLSAADHSIKKGVYKFQGKNAKGFAGIQLRDKPATGDPATAATGSRYFAREGELEDIGVSGIESSREGKEQLPVAAVAGSAEWVDL
jgi:putative DNA primase/helicase